LKAPFKQRDSENNVGKVESLAGDVNLIDTSKILLLAFQRFTKLICLQQGVPFFILFSISFSFIAKTFDYKEFYLRETNSIELVTYNCLRN